MWHVYTHLRSGLACNYCSQAQLGGNLDRGQRESNAIHPCALLSDATQLAKALQSLSDGHFVTPLCALALQRKWCASIAALRMAEARRQSATANWAACQHIALSWHVQPGAQPLSTRCCEVRLCSDAASAHGAMPGRSTSLVCLYACRHGSGAAP
jgi:hypothetical protein